MTWTMERRKVLIWDRRRLARLEFHAALMNIGNRTRFSYQQEMLPENPNLSPISDKESSNGQASSRSSVTTIHRPTPKSSAVGRVAVRGTVAVATATAVAAAAATTATNSIATSFMPPMVSATSNVNAFLIYRYPTRSTPTRHPSSTRWKVVMTPSTTPKQENFEPTRKRKRQPKTNRMSKVDASVSLDNRTQSFGAVTYATYKSHGEQIDLNVTPVDIHTLILGTHPGIQSLEKCEYYGHPMNAFWWIAGDCLGFRRDTGISKRSGKPYQFTSHLRHGPDRILPSYQDQLQVLTSHGFALWDIVQSCERPQSSLDSDITHDQPNNIPDFCQQHSHSLKRIVLANGTSGSTFFKKHFRTWLNSGACQVIRTPKDTTASTSTTGHQSSSMNKKPSAPIVVIPALAVSPAAAKYTYQGKRDFWDQYVYQPGLKDHFENLSQQDKRGITEKDK